MRTEDFVSSAERSPALRLDPSTVVRIDTSHASKGYNLLTLSYGEHRTQVRPSPPKRGNNSCLVLFL
jgi:hypothetical protein